MKKYKICTRCVMDNKSDETITFDEKGYCNYCTDALNRMSETYFPNEEGERRLNQLLERLKKENKYKKYDCIMGISGGLDSSYLAYLGAVKWGLRILAVHIDDGFDSEITKKNLEKLEKATGIEMNIIKPNATQFNELTRAFMLAGVPNLAVPQDNVLFASIYKYAKQNGIRSFLSGGNFSLECILQKGNTHSAYDTKNIKDIAAKFSRKRINKLPLISEFQRAVDSKILKVESPRPLNYIEYDRDRALQELNEFCGFEYYGSKHLENTLTKFIQLFWFPQKFNVDKRNSHFSSMIVSNQMTRDEALELLQKPLYDPIELEADLKLIMNKLDLSQEEFNKIMEETPKQHDYYKTSNFNKNMKVIVNVVKRLKN